METEQEKTLKQMLYAENLYLDKECIIDYSCINGYNITSVNDKQINLCNTLLKQNEEYQQALIDDDFWTIVNSECEVIEYVFKVKPNTIDA